MILCEDFYDELKDEQEDLVSDIESDLIKTYNFSFLIKIGLNHTPGPDTFYKPKLMVSCLKNVLSYVKNVNEITFDNEIILSEIN